MAYFYVTTSFSIPLTEVQSQYAENLISKFQRFSQYREEQATLYEELSSSFGELDKTALLCFENLVYNYIGENLDFDKETKKGLLKFWYNHDDYFLREPCNPLFKLIQHLIQKFNLPPVGFSWSYTTNSRLHYGCAVFITKNEIITTDSESWLSEKSKTLVYQENSISNAKKRNYEKICHIQELHEKLFYEVVSTKLHHH